MPINVEVTEKELYLIMLVVSLLQTSGEKHVRDASLALLHKLSKYADENGLQKWIDEND